MAPPFVFPKRMKANIFWIGTVLAGRLAIMPRPRGGDWLDDDLRSLTLDGVRTVVSLLTPPEARELTLEHEAERCAALGLDFLSLPVPDLGTPASHDDAFCLAAAVRERLAAGNGVAIHCRAGIGRSSTLAACVLALCGAVPRDGFERIAAARGCPVPETDDQR